MDCCVWCRRGSREPKQHGDDNLPYAAALLLPRSKSRAENHRPHGNLHSRNGVGSNLASTSRVSRQTSGTILVRLLGETSDRKSTRLNSSHANISYAVFCLKKIKMPRTND